MERILMNMGRRFLMRYINKGVNAGIDRALGPDTKTPENAQQRKKAQELSKKARQGAKLVRRMGRF